MVQKKSEKLSKAANKGYIRGACLNDLHEIKQLEEQLRSDHFDIETRCTLLGVFAQPDQNDCSAQWCKHFEWLIKNCPDEDFMKDHVWRAPKSVSDEQFAGLAKAFLQKAERNKKNSDVLGNAAVFICQRDKLTAIKLFKQAKKLSPNNPWWSSLLFTVYRSLALEGKSQKYAERTFKLGDKLIADRMRKDGKTFFLTQTLCAFALESNALKRAKKYLKALKNPEHKDACEWRRHQLAGLLALKAGEPERARKQLMKAAHNGDPLEDLQLANLILKDGDFHTPKIYLELCLTHPHNRKHRKIVKHWISQLNKGVAVDLV